MAVARASPDLLSRSYHRPSPPSDGTWSLSAGQVATLYSRRPRLPPRPPSAPRRPALSLRRRYPLYLRRKPRPCQLVSPEPARGRRRPRAAVPCPPAEHLPDTTPSPPKFSSSPTPILEQIFRTDIPIVRRKNRFDDQWQKGVRAGHEIRSFRFGFAMCTARFRRKERLLTTPPANMLVAICRAKTLRTVCVPS